MPLECLDLHFQCCECVLYDRSDRKPVLSAFLKQMDVGSGLEQQDKDVLSFTMTKYNSNM